MTVYRRARALRDYLISTDEAARMLHITENRIRTLAREGYIKPHSRKGFYRLGDVVDGHAEAVKMGALTRPMERGNGRTTFSCSVDRS
ncbi:helix-turn-helix domain-containing protein [Rhizobium sp. 21-4511-3d]